MTRKIKNTIAIGFPLLMLIISAALFYLTVKKSEQSLISLHSKIELKKGNYNLYSLNADKAFKKKFEIDGFENKTHDTLHISLKTIKKRFIWASETIVINDKQYEYLNSVKISTNGNYHILLDNPQKVKIGLAIQNQDQDNVYLKSILIYYMLSIISFILILVVVVIICIRTILTKYKKT
ncbi:hypothetical protein AR687_09820 [Flavobacteriaceae bacterium CRH]|nr:hypothetical protein AR687_09820 [Flavobacteriaceae bacterium CRH]